MAGPLKILSLDGGGVRGAVTAQFLELLEKELPDGIFGTFDLFAGTSAGALTALHLAVNKASAKECVDLFNLENARIFMDKSMWDRILPIETGPKYDGKGKQQILLKMFGESKLRQDAKKPVLVTAYDIVMRRIVVYKSSGGSDTDHDPSVVEIAAASSAAPTFFPTVRAATDPPRWLADGGLAANNPAMVVLAEALRQGRTVDDIKLVSIGTGVPTRDKHRADEMGRESQSWGGLGWLGHGLIEHLFSGGSSAVEYQCAQILGCDNYIRVDGPLDGASDDMDDVSEGNINNLKRLGQEWYRTHGQPVLKLLRG